jgi:hypothetical protein
MHAACPYLTQLSLILSLGGGDDLGVSHIVISGILPTFFLTDPVIFLQSALLQHCHLCSLVGVSDPVSHATADTATVLLCFSLYFFR